MRIRRVVAISLLAGGIATAAALVVAGCLALAGRGPGHGTRPTPDELRQSLVDAAAPLKLAPFGPGTTDPIAVSIKGGPAYYVITGVVTGTPAAAQIELIQVLQAQGWTIVRQGPVDHFLGWEALATRDSTVLLASVGDEAVGVAGSPYQRVPGHSYVQLAAAGRNSTPDWSRIGR